jgi:pimeloyl-ACP methyl ester carboxylesterase
MIAPIHSIEAGEGAPVILVHGLASSLCGWNEMIPALTGHNCHVYAIDLIGHGESPKPGEISAYDVAVLSESLENWIGGLHLSRPPLLVGHSLGGYLSLAYALRHPDGLRGLVLVDPLYSPGQLSLFTGWVRLRPGLATRAMRLAPGWVIEAAAGVESILLPKLSLEARRQIALDCKRASPQVMHLLRNLHDLAPALPAIQTRALVVWGEWDPMLRPVSFPRLVRALPCASGFAIRRSGHGPHISQAGQVNRLVLEFLQDLP